MVENIRIDGTENSPEVDFDFQANAFQLRGMSYLEDVNAFFKPVLDSLRGHLEGQQDADVAFTVELTYFNSSSARILLRIFDCLEAAAEKGNRVTVTWRYAEDDDTMEEQGEDLGEELEHAQFRMEAVPD